MNPEAPQAEQSANGTEQKKAKKSIWTKRYWTIEALKMTALYVALSPFVAWPLYTHMIFFPDKTDYAKTIEAPLQQLKKRFGVTDEDVYFNTPDGKRLHGLYLARPGAKKVFLVCHGNGGNIAHRMDLAASLLVCNGNVFLFDYEGYGSSEGEPSIKGVVRDGVAAYDCLNKTRHVDPSDIIIYGESLGTGAAAQVSLQRKVAAIILQSGFTSLISAGKDHLFFLRFYPDSWFPDNLDNVAAMQKPHPPLLIFHGKQDPVLAFHNAETLFAEAVQPKKFIALSPFEHAVERADIKEFNQPIAALIQSLDTVPASPHLSNMP